MRAAMTILSARGYQGLSIAGVAAEAGIATGTVYKHFTGKVALMAAVFREVVSHEVDAVAAASKSGSVVARVTAAVETFAGRALKNPKLAYALLAEPVDAEVDVERLAFRRAFAEVFTEAVTAGVETGAIRPQDPHFTAVALVGAAAEVLIGPLSTDPRPEVVLPELVAFSLRALGVTDANA